MEEVLPTELYEYKEALKVRVEVHAEVRYEDELVRAYQPRKTMMMRKHAQVQPKLGSKEFLDNFSHVA